MQQQQRRLRGRRAWRQLLLLRAGTAFAARRVSVSRSLLRTWELLAVEVSRHLGNLVAVEEEEVMVTELGGEVEVDKEERKTLMC